MTHSVSKESACSAGDPSSISGSGRSAEEAIGYPLQYSWASLLAQLVKNLPAMQETWVQLLSWETPSCAWRRAWQSFQYTIPVGSDGKESACNAGDLGLIPGLGRSPREGNGYPLQYSWLGAGASRQSRSGPENMHGAAEKENYSKLQQRWGREVQTRLLEGTQSDHDFILSFLHCRFLPPLSKIRCP